jgi:superfamily II DNA or RNA helicase
MPPSVPDFLVNKRHIFISHSSEDTASAEKVCRALESDGLATWICSRDIQPGQTWAGAITDGLKRSGVVVLLFTKHANKSQHVLREINAAVAQNIPILPVRLDSSNLSEDIEFYINVAHWISAPDGNVEPLLGKITQGCLVLLSSDAGRQTPSFPIPQPTNELEATPREVQLGRQNDAHPDVAPPSRSDLLTSLEQIKVGSSLTGLEPEMIVSVMANNAIGTEAAQIIYKLPDGTMRERLIGSADLHTLAVATTERPWSFDADGDAFKLAVEAKRIDLAFLFDPMMAVHTSNVEPLPHQITAVYQSMLPRQPLRFVLADDPGAGKTIMTGLYIRELIMRADSRRILIVAPGSLVEQWRDELFEKFGLQFNVFSSALEAATPTGNPFEDIDHLIVRLDQVARNEVLQDKLLAASWDLVVFDEAHKLSAHYFGSKLEKTGRFQFAEKLGARTRHLLLLTATPHNGKPEDFQLFLSLLDSDRFYGRFRGGGDAAHQIDASDLMRRMVKEEMVRFDGTRLFPERKAYTANYKLSEIEAALYEAVTSYVKTEMGKADALKGPRKGSVGFALTALQRRLASSPEAIFQSLRRRKERLEARLREERLLSRGQQFTAQTLETPPEDDDDLTAEEQEDLEEKLVDTATAAETIAELEEEIGILADLVVQARGVVDSGLDRKWDELSKILQNDPNMRDADGRQRKMIIFTEHKDTLNYLERRIGGVLGTPDAITTIHGGVHRDERRNRQEMFRSDPEVRILLATDAAGEGVNLQNANLMVNYDLPWNPNRLEQRFGRIHRIGQQQVCHLWNLVAKETREGEVYHRLLTKLENINEAFHGRVFDILGEVFEERTLKDLLLDAIRYNDQPERHAERLRTIDHAFDTSHIKDLLERNALAQETMSTERLFAVKEQMEMAEARRLQPFFVRSFFTKAFESLNGAMHPREQGRFEITHVPALLRERDRQITGRNRRELAPVLRRYERVCFTKEAVRPLDRPNVPFAQMIHPGHPLMLAVSDLVLEQHSNLMRQGAILVDPADDGTEASLLFLITHEIKSGNSSVLSKRLQFVRVDPDGKASFAGWAPHLDYEPLATADRPLLADLLQADWIRADQEQRAITLAATTLVPEHYEEVAMRRIAHVDKTLAAVHERLTNEIAFWSDRWMKLREDQEAGKDVRLNIDNIQRTINDLNGRLENRKKELQSMRHITNGTPVILGGALVVPVGLLRKLRGEPAPDRFSADPAERSRIEQLAMDAVRRAEEARGYRVVDVSAKKCGWDITSYALSDDGKIPASRHIEVKGRISSARTITVTRNEIFESWNQGAKFHLAIVLVGEDESIDGPHYLPHPFKEEPGWGVTSVNYDIRALLEKAQQI